MMKSTLSALGTFRGLIAAVVAGGLVLAPVASWAHAILLDSTPAPGSHQAAGHVAIRLRFNSRIDAARSRVTLTEPGQAGSVLAIAAGPTPDVLEAAADRGPGAYGLRWQVLAVDGHITRGDVGFTLTPNTGSPSTGASVTSASTR